MRLSNNVLPFRQDNPAAGTGPARAVHVPEAALETGEVDTRRAWTQNRASGDTRGDTGGGASGATDTRRRRRGGNTVVDCADSRLFAARIRTRGEDDGRQVVQGVAVDERAQAAVHESGLTCCADARVHGAGDLHGPRVGGGRVEGQENRTLVAGSQSVC